MQISARRFISPFAAVVTLAIGIAVVAPTHTFLSLFSSSFDAQNQLPLTVRASDHTDPIAHDDFELSCYDLSILPVWRLMKQDGEFKKWTDRATGAYDCSQLVQVKTVDLDRNGHSEVWVRGKGALCKLRPPGCFLWVFDKRNSRYKTLFSSQDFPAAESSHVSATVLQSRVHGYVDLLIRTRVSEIETQYSKRSFNGKEYVEKRCISEVLKDKDHLTQWELISCKGSELRRSPEKTWLEYEPTVVELEGRLVVKTYFGPPNFGENPESDSKEKEWILSLDKPISVRGRRAAGYDGTSVEDVREIELVLLGSHKDLTGKKVIVTGKLFPAHTGHHHTDVLMDVQAIRLAASN